VFIGATCLERKVMEKIVEVLVVIYMESIVARHVRHRKLGREKHQKNIYFQEESPFSIDVKVGKKIRRGRSKAWSQGKQHSHGRYVSCNQ